MLNILWPIFIIISIIYAFLTGNLQKLNNSIFESTENSVKLFLTLIGNTCLWSGIMEIAMQTNITKYLAKLLKPFMKKLFNEIDEKNKSYENILMNIIANILGLGNAATPLGLKAMESLQNENIDKEKLSDKMMMLIVLNTASLQVIPTTIMAIRNSMGSENSSKIIFPIWISAVCALFVAIIVCKFIIIYTKK